MITKTPWINGYGDGVTGPTTPAIGGPTVGAAIQYNEWVCSNCKSPYPKQQYKIVSTPDRGGKIGSTVAILPFRNGEEIGNAALIVAAPRMLQILSRFETSLTADERALILELNNLSLDNK